MARPRARSSIAAAFLAALGLLMVLRYQGPIQERILARRLAEDLAPDEGVKTARALHAANPAALTLLGPEAKLRFLLANGFAGSAATAPVAAAGHDADAKLVETIRRREGEAIAAVITLTAAYEDLVFRWLAEAGEPEIRRRAAQALSRGGDARAFGPLVKAFQDPDDGVRKAAFRAGPFIAARVHDEPARIQFLAEAARVPSLVTYAITSVDVTEDPEAIPVLVAYLSLPELKEGDRERTTTLIRKLAGPERAAAAPTGTAAADWQRWLDGAPK